MKILSRIEKELAEIKAAQIENNVQLKEHMRRTELNEMRIEKLEKWLLGLLTAILLAAVTKGLI